MNTLDEWVGAACAELDLGRDLVDVKAVLDLARDVAHDVARPAAPLGAFVLGLAIGGGQDPEQAAQRLRALAAGWDSGA